MCGGVRGAWAGEEEGTGGKVLWQQRGRQAQRKAHDHAILEAHVLLEGGLWAQEQLHALAASPYSDCDTTHLQRRPHTRSWSAVCSKGYQEPSLNRIFGSVLKHSTPGPGEWRRGWLSEPWLLIC